MRPSGLAIDTLELLPVVHLWAVSPWANGTACDRLIFDRIRTQPHGCTEKATVYFAIDPRDERHQDRLAFLRSKGIEIETISKEESSR